MSAVLEEDLEITYRRLTGEEGVRNYAYNDRTGARVTCNNPVDRGNLSIGIGINLENGLDEEEIKFLTGRRLEKIRTRLSAYPWFGAIQSPQRRSVLIDIAFNAGVGGLLGFRRMIDAIEAQDWDRAALECHAADPRLDSRYDNLARILKTGGP